ncbi:glycosyltransferase family 8 protein [Xylariaceae sp. FL0662B]|nr:glycosyltransferase family 8 protein [Xylariaceae sp. FL0662B]
MAVQGGVEEEDVYATLLLSDTYLPGALVLAHSLRDAGTTKKLAVLVTLDSVSAEAITQLQTVYHYVIPVSRIRNTQPANLHLMNRADLHSAFTKINLWKQTQFRKIVYIDSDVVAYRAPDELFDIPHPFSAAPDIGWPDLFNTGVMVLTPNMADYYALMAMAERNISFDGADQGLLNMHFQNSYNRISFTYNVTPSAHYQYIPAYRHFQSSINMVHFIGADKPWFKGRHATTGSAPFDEMTGRWWSVYDRHYRVPSPTSTPSAPYGLTPEPAISRPSPELVQYLTKGEYQPNAPNLPVTGEPYGDHQGHEQSFQHAQQQEHYEQFDQYDASHHEAHDHDDHGDHDDHPQPHPDHVEALPEATVQQPGPTTSPSAASSSFFNVEGTHAEAREEQVPESHHHGVSPSQEPERKPEPFQPTMSSWDAQRHPPPANSKPEAANFPATVYEMSRDSAPFVAPKRYPSPPKDMWYEVPKEPPAPSSEPLKPIFPWEMNQPPPSRVFADEPSTSSGGPRPLPVFRLPSESAVTEASTVEQKSEPVTPTTPTVHVTASDPWVSYTRTNAWDEVPEIERYVDAMQKHRRKRSIKSPGVIGMPIPSEGVDEIAWRRQGSKLTDFPSEVERPSLPVTPAPIRRPKFWGGGDGGPGEGDKEGPSLPAAEGVPPQDIWVCVHGRRWKRSDCICDLTNVLRYHKDPVAQLQKLAQQQSEILLKKLGGGHHDSSDLPPRPVPFGSEKVISPTFAAQSAKVLGTQPVKGSTSSSAVRDIVSDVDTAPWPPLAQPEVAVEILEPSYAGPGPAFEKGETVPTTPRPSSAQHRVEAKVPEPSYSGPRPAFEKGETADTTQPPLAQPEVAAEILEPSYAGPGPAFEKGETIGYTSRGYAS